LIWRRIQYSSYKEIDWSAVGGRGSTIQGGGEVGQWGTVRNRGVVAMEVMTGLTGFGSEAEWLK